MKHPLLTIAPLLLATLVGCVDSNIRSDSESTKRSKSLSVGENQARYEVSLGKSGQHEFDILVNKDFFSRNDALASQLDSGTFRDDTFIKVPPNSNNELERDSNYELIKIYSSSAYPSFEPGSTPSNSIFRDTTFDEKIFTKDATRESGVVLYSTSFDQDKFLRIANLALRHIEAHTKFKVEIEAPSSISQEFTTAKLLIERNPSIRIEKVLFIVNESVLTVDRTSSEHSSRISETATYNLGLPFGANHVRVKVFADNGEIAEDDIYVESKFKAKPTLHLVAIGINKFSKMADLDLSNAVADAELVRKFFASQAGKLFSDRFAIEPHILDTTKTTKSNIDLLLQNVSRNTKPNDYFVLYVASHGFIFGEEYYFAPSDIEIKFDSQSFDDSSVTDGFGDQQISDYLINIPTIFRMAILDTCHSGKQVDSIKSLLETVTTGKKDGVTVLTAAKSYQLALDNYNGHGLFTFILIRGLEGEADYNQDGIVDSIEIAEYVKTNVGKVASEEMGFPQDAVVLPDPSNSFNRRFELAILTPKDVEFKPNVFTPMESSLYIDSIRRHDKQMMDGIIKNNLRHKHGNANSINDDQLSKDRIVEMLLQHESADLNILFQANSHDPGDSELKKLEIIADALNSSGLATRRIFVEGHADSTGDESFNMTLSQSRADSVTELLITRYGIQASRIRGLGYGETYPVADNETPAGRERNRRVSIFVYQ